MIISERQLLQLIRICEAYCGNLHRFGEDKALAIIQDLLAEINDQQLDNLEEIK